MTPIVSLVGQDDRGVTARSRASADRLQNETLCPCRFARKSAGAAAEPGANRRVVVPMKNNDHELSARERAQATEELMLPAAELFGLLMAAVLLLGIVFGLMSPPLPIL